MRFESAGPRFPAPALTALASTGNNFDVPFKAPERLTSPGLVDDWPQALYCSPPNEQRQCCRCYAVWLARWHGRRCRTMHFEAGTQGTQVGRTVEV